VNKFRWLLQQLKLGAADVLEYIAMSTILHKAPIDSMKANA